MMRSLWRALLGLRPGEKVTTNRQETINRLQGLMRERQQIDQSGERWRKRMQEAIADFDVVAEEALSSRYGDDHQ